MNGQLGQRDQGFDQHGESHGGQQTQPNPFRSHHLPPRCHGKSHRKRVMPCARLRPCNASPAKNQARSPSIAAQSDMSRRGTFTTTRSHRLSADQASRLSIRAVPAWPVSCSTVVNGGLTKLAVAMSLKPARATSWKDGAVEGWCRQFECPNTSPDTLSPTIDLPTLTW